MISLIGKTNNKGFTLIEVCLVGVVLSLIFAISWPILNRSARLTQLETTCKEISYTLRYARDYALNENKYYTVEFNIPEHSYGLAGSARYWPKDIEAGVSDQKLIFSPDGTSPDFKISLKNIQGNICTLKLEGSTGKTTIQTQK
ncbi:MAG: hypothetical protein A3J83_08790 [Elusimicrobia bacterium RIFOXYA2_FULL_40_6]|nr:MAG: hypothetical protein A3J83_08790 [Elusimicrobia bacterium RIFOXYA2_FULL_40_6]